MEHAKHKGMEDKAESPWGWGGEFGGCIETPNLRPTNPSPPPPYV